MSPSLHVHAPHLHLHHGHRDGGQPGGSAYTDATPKGSHYATTLDAIRRLALWNCAAPALAKGDVNWNAAPTTTAAARTSTAAGTGAMNWNEVLRKFRKHNPNRLRACSHRHDLVLDHELKKLSPLGKQSPPPPPPPNGHSGLCLQRLRLHYAEPQTRLCLSRRKSLQPTYQPRPNRSRTSATRSKPCKAQRLRSTRRKLSSLSVIGELGTRIRRWRISQR
jgi:hypothetical protein